MKAAGGSIEYISKHELNLVVDNRPHQVSPCTLHSVSGPPVQGTRSCLPGIDNCYFMQICVLDSNGIQAMSPSTAGQACMQGQDVMQGLVLDCSALEWQLMDQFPPAEEAAATSKRLPIWLALDEVEDPVSSCCPGS